MATFSGKDGVVTVDTGAELNVRSWSIEEASGTPGGAHSDSAGWTDTYCGTKSWSGSFSFYQDDTVPQPVRAGDEATVSVVDKTAGNTYSGSIVVSSVSYEGDIEGGELVGGSVNFTGSGALTIT